MSRGTLIFWVILVLTLAVSVLGADRSAKERSYQRADAAYSNVMFGAPVSTGKAQVDTVYLMGGPDRPDGKFETAGEPDLQSWTSVDLTARTAVNWNCSTYNAQNLDPGTPGNHAWWCGQYWEHDCGTGDYGGYGNNWEEYLAWSGTPTNPSQQTTVTVNAVLNYDNEPDYDYLYLQYETASGWVQTSNGIFNGTNYNPDTMEWETVVLSETFTLTPADYVGDDGEEIHIRWRFGSDGGWSDEDCSWPTRGAAQVDRLEVYFDQGGGPVQQGATETCEPGDPVQWDIEFPLGVGDYAYVWPILGDIDPCRTNLTPQVAFIDHPDVGVSGGYEGTTWRYGPGGYIVNPEGGLAGPDFHIQNEIWSPVLTWPEGAYDGAHFHFEVYSHETLSATSPGVFYVWHVRSTPSADPADIQEAGWTDRNFVYYGGPNYLREESVQATVSDLMVPNRQYVQLALGVYELGWVWNWNGTDGTPAPYFDNVLFRVFAFAGPAVTTRGINHFQDNFPEIGLIDYDDLGANHVRLDMAQNISPGPHQRNDPGDSVYFDVVAVRTGSVLNDLPKMYYKLFPNPLFDSYRTSGLPNQGWIYGDTCYTGTGTPLEDRYVWDLPDTGFFYPGDRLHYYIEAQDNLGGDIGTTLLPADTSGFSLAPGMDSFVPTQYQFWFVVRALPTLATGLPGDQPEILFWRDTVWGNENEWIGALGNLGYQEGTDYDQYHTIGAASAVGNGLGGRATATQLAEYDVLLYTCGSHVINTISNGDFDSDAGNDVGVLDSWLRSTGGGKRMFLTGDNLVFDMTQNSGMATLAFVNNWIGVNFVDLSVRSLIAGQAAPTVRALPGNGVFNAIEQWIAYGGCVDFNDFDAVEAQVGATRLAEYLDPSGATGQYSYAAATLKVESTYDAETIYLPYDFMYIYSDDSTGGDGEVLSARARVLKEVLLHFGQVGSSPTVPVPDSDVMTVQHYPNPFNPATKVAYYLPRRSELRLRIYDLRGALVRTLLQEERPAGGGEVIWDGTDDTGRAVASGIYFLETVAMGEVRTSKLALVR